MKRSPKQTKETEEFIEAQLRAMAPEKSIYKTPNELVATGKYPDLEQAIIERNNLIDKYRIIQAEGGSGETTRKQMEQVELKVLDLWKRYRTMAPEKLVYKTIGKVQYPHITKKKTALYPHK
jgi:hypothetical protein